MNTLERLNRLKNIKLIKKPRRMFYYLLFNLYKNAKAIEPLLPDVNQDTKAN